MRFSLVVVALAALLVASVALAKTQTSATITSLSASGISGTADFSILGNGQVRVHESLSGLSPGVQYVTFVYQGSTTCGAGATTAMIQTFTSNPAGKANFDVVVPAQVNINPGASVSVQRVTDNALLACGEIQ